MDGILKPQKLLPSDYFLFTYNPPPREVHGWNELLHFLLKPSLVSTYHHIGLHDYSKRLCVNSSRVHHHLFIYFPFFPTRLLVWKDFGHCDNELSEVSSHE